MTSWFDQGAEVKVFTAEDGDTIENGIRNDYPFQTGGPSPGLPQGWTEYFVNTSSWATVNATTRDGRFSVSNAQAPTVGNSQFWGIQRKFPVTEGRNYVISAQCRKMQDRDSATRYLVVESWTNTAKVATVFSYALVAMDDWETVAGYTTNLPTGQGITQINVIVFAGFSYSATDPPPGQGPNWGVQFQNISILETPATPQVITWHEVTCDVQGVNVRYGRERAGQRYDVGTFTVVLRNQEGQYAYNEPHDFGLRPGRFIKGIMERPNSAVQYPLFYGIIDSIVDGFSLDGRATTTISALDNSTILANINVPTANHTASFEPLSDSRIRYILNAIGYKNYNASMGSYYQQAVLSSGRSVRDELEVTTDSEGGRLWVNPAGVLYYRGRTYSTIQDNEVTADLIATDLFNDDDELPVIDDVPNWGNPPRICTTDLVVDWSRDRIVNLVSLANQNGSAFVFENDASQKKYGPYTFQRHDLVNSNTYPEYLAERAADIMDGYSDPVLRVNSVTFKPQPHAWTWLTTVALNWLVRVWYVHPVGGWAFVVCTHIQSIEHRISSGDWEVTFTLDQPVSFIRFDYSSRGWDVAEWDTDIWDGD